MVAARGRARTHRSAPLPSVTVPAAGASVEAMKLGRRHFAGALGAVAAAAIVRPGRAAATTVDYAWDGRDIGHPERAWFGRAHLSAPTLAAKGPRPLVVFLHGLNAALIKYRWMGGGSEGDVRDIVGKLAERGAVEPPVVAAPSSIVASQVSRGASWNFFDLDHFIDCTRRAVATFTQIDETRIVVAGHSGAGCSTQGGLARVGESRRKLHGIFAIDTCMSVALADRLARSPKRTHVVVGFQTLGWTDRPFRAFRRTFERVAAEHPPDDGVLRELDEQKPEAAYHDATVPLTLTRWLPRILPPHHPEG